MAQTSTFEPASIQAGDTIRWQRALPDYLAGDGWQLSYRLINPNGRIDIVALADGDAHVLEIAAATSAAYPPGEYVWVAHVTRGTDRHTVGQGQLRIRADFAAIAQGGADARSPAVRALSDLRGALLRWLSSNGHVQEYDIAGRRMKFATAIEIRERIAMAEREVAREAAAERMAAGQSAPRRVLVRF